MEVTSKSLSGARVFSSVIAGVLRERTCVGYREVGRGIRQDSLVRRRVNHNPSKGDLCFEAHVEGKLLENTVLSAQI